MKPLMYGMAALAAYVAFVLYERGDWIYAAVPVFAAGVAYGVTKEKSE